MTWSSTPDVDMNALLERELERQNTTLQLIASENFASPAVMQATGSVFTNKYSEGYPGKRYYGGNEVVDEVEALAIARIKALFGAEHANVQPHSGANANTAVYLGLLKPGDKVLGMSLDHGGHLTHGHPVNFSGLTYDFAAYGVTKSDERIDYDEVRDIAKRERPRLIVAGATAYPRIIDPVPLRSIADEVGALLMFDAAHIAGLIVGGVHPNPMPYCDIVTFTTHKTMRGPRGGCILSRAEHAAAIDRAVFPGFQGGPLEHVIAAKAISFHEAAQPEFAAYAKRIVTNASALANGLAAEGFRLVSGGTDNHLMLVDLRPFDAELTGKQAQAVCDAAGISLNKNTIPDDPRSPFVTSGVRIGTPAVTTQGMGPAEMSQIATLIARALRGRNDEAALVGVRGRRAHVVRTLHPLPALSRPAHMPEVRHYGAIFALAAVITFVLTAVMRVVAPRVGAIVAPDERRVHERPTPTLGGVAMFGGFIGALVVASRTSVFNGSLEPDSFEGIGLIVAAFIILLVGLIDDLREISAPAKVAGMVLAGVVLHVAGLSIVVFEFRSSASRHSPTTFQP